MLLLVYQMLITQQQQKKMQKKLLSKCESRSEQWKARALKYAGKLRFSKEILLHILQLWAEKVQICLG